jgi:basic amino acid/polyamine antiporter, APA family
MAFIFAEYADQIFRNGATPSPNYVLVAYAASSIVALTAINILGVREGKWTQDVLTVAKVLGLAAIVAVGFAHPALGTTSPRPAVFADITVSKFGLAMIFVLFAYGGWNEMAFVSAEVKEPRKNIFRGLVIGTLAVTVIYVLVNLAFLCALGLDGTRHATVAADVLTLGIGPWAGQVISLLICISALGAINGQIFTGSRIYYAMGNDHRLYAWLGRWNARRGTPVCSLLIQGAITLALSIWFGLSRNGFESMVKFTTPVFWIFMAMVAVSVFVLRRRDADVERPYRLPGYPLTPIVFCASCSFMVYSSVTYAIENRSWEAIWSILILVAGVAMSLYGARAPPSGRNSHSPPWDGSESS